MNRKNIVLCGRSGDGKSTIANMLIQGDVYPDSENDFKVGNNARAVTEYLTAISNEKFIVYDTIGFGDSNGNKEATKSIRNFFSMCKIPLNYICFVKRSRSLKEDVRLFETYKKVFEDGEKHFVIIITHSGPEWTKKEENVKLIKEQLGNYPIISVDFPCNKNEKYTKIDREQRKESLNHLLNELSKLEYNKIHPEVLSSSQSIENDMAGYFSFVPVIGSVYQLTASGFYYVIGKEKTAKKRLLDGSLGLVCDTAGLVTGIGDPSMLVNDVSLRALKGVITAIKNFF